MHFRYLENERLQLWFINPNYCAAFLCMALLLGIGLFCLLRAKRDNLFLLIPFATAIIAGEYLLAITYSRGGYIAFAIGLTVAGILCRRKIPILFLATFFLLILVIPGGSVRLESIGDIQEGSIRSRLLLWSGGLRLLGKYPFGLGMDTQIGEYYTILYQPLWLDERYFEFVNDILSFSIRYGLPALFVIASIVLWIITEAITVQRENKWTFYPFVIATAIAYLILGLFTTFYFVGQIISIWGLSLLILFGTSLWAWKRKSHKLSCRRNCYVIIAAFAFCLSLFIGGSLWELNHKQYIFSSDPMDFSNDASLKEGKLLQHAKGHIICVLPSELSPFPSAVRSIMRPVLEKGYNISILTIATDSSGINAFQKQLSAIKPELSANGKNILYAEKTAARIAFIGLVESPELASPLDHVIFFELEESWPWAELSPVDRANEFPISAIFVECTSSLFHDSDRYAKLLAVHLPQTVDFKRVIVNDAKHPMASKSFFQTCLTKL